MLAGALGCSLGCALGLAAAASGPERLSPAANKDQRVEVDARTVLAEAARAYRSEPTHERIVMVVRAGAPDTSIPPTTATTPTPAAPGPVLRREELSVRIDPTTQGPVELRRVASMALELGPLRVASVDGVLIVTHRGSPGTFFRDDLGVAGLPVEGVTIAALRRRLAPVALPSLALASGEGEASLSALLLGDGEGRWERATLDTGRDEPLYELRGVGPDGPVRMTIDARSGRVRTLAFAVRVRSGATGAVGGGEDRVVSVELTITSASPRGREAPIELPDLRARRIVWQVDELVER
jgi:hypothetical protein